MKKWLFNPFELLAGWNALFIGLAVMLLTAVIAYYGHIHLDGVFDLHEGGKPTFGITVLEGIIDCLSITLLAYLAGLFFSTSSIRFIDVLGTQALARFPFLLSCIVSWICFDEKILAYFDYTLLHKGEPVALTTMDIVRFGTMTLLDLLLLIWAVILMYRAYSVSCNVTGNKGILTFSGVLIVAEVVSKILIYYCP